MENEGQKVNIVNAGPSEASPRRTQVDANFSFQTINTSGIIAKTVTSGKRLFVTDIILTVVNANTADSICSIKDGSDVKIPFLAGGSTTEGNGQFTLIKTFKEPVPFDTSVVVVSGNGSGVVASCFVCGYEETIKQVVS